MTEEVPLIDERRELPAKETQEFLLESEPAADLSAEVSPSGLRQSPLALHLAIPQAELCDSLRKALEKAASRNAESMEALRAAVAGFTAALRDAGNTPEGVLVTLKTVINNRSLVLIAPHASDWRGDQLREKVSRWCIEEFFKEKMA